MAHIAIFLSTTANRPGVGICCCFFESLRAETGVVQMNDCWS